MNTLSVDGSAPGDERFKLARFMQDAALPSLRVGSTALFAGAMQLLPVTAAIYKMVETYIAMMESERRQAFLDGVEGSRGPVPFEHLNSPNFARSAYVSAEAAARTTNDKKAHMIGKMLRNGLEQGLLDSFDDFKEYVQIVDALHPQEIAIVVILKELADEHDVLRSGRVNDAIAQRLELPSGMVDALLHRINSTGLVLRQPTMDGGALIHLSPLFYRVSEILEDKAGLE